MNTLTRTGERLRDQSQRAGRRLRREASPERLAVGLGWFSIALGVAEVVAPAAVARLCGLKPGHTGVLRLHGLREIAVGIGILRSRNASPWLWGRVGGDLMDMATIVAGADKGSINAIGRASAALTNVAAITALDVYTAQNWYQPADRQAGVDYPDYSDRSGFPRAPEAMRGAALADFETPRDMRAPEALRPWQDGKPVGQGPTSTPGGSIGNGPATAPANPAASGAGSATGSATKPAAASAAGGSGGGSAADLGIESGKAASSNKTGDAGKASPKASGKSGGNAGGA